MPQLNPGPWFLIMTLSWFTFLFVMQPKSMSFISSNFTFDKTKATSQSTSWPWPWT